MRNRATGSKTWKHAKRYHTSASLQGVVDCVRLQGQYGVEIRIESVNKDNSHSWVRISHGLNKLVTDLSNREDDDNEQETSEMQFEDLASKTNVLAFACRSKAKAKTTKTYFCLLIYKNCSYL